MPAFYGSSSDNSSTTSDVEELLLKLKGMGVKDPSSFDFVTAPDTAGIARATKILYALGALDDKLELTDHGRKLAKLPLDPTFGNLLVKSEEYACTKEVLTAISVLSAENIFYRPSAVAQRASIAHRRFTSHEGDLSTFLRIIGPHLEAVQRRQERNKPIHLLGIADLQSIHTAIPFGMDTFDSSYPTKVCLHRFRLFHLFISH